MRGFSVLLAGVVVAGACGGGNHAGKDGAGGDDQPGSDGSNGGSDAGGIDADLSCPTPGVIPPLKAQRVTTDNLDQPIFMAQPKGSTDLYVVQKPGQIVIVRNGNVLPTPFLDVSSEVLLPSTECESGLLGLEFSPTYATDGRFFIYMGVKASGGNINRGAVREYHRDPNNPDIADAGFAPIELLSYPQDGFNGMGGTIAFGPDGFLWWGAGDGERVPSDAENLESRFGKFFRIDVDHPGVAPPNGLPGTSDPFIWDYGVRNPYRFSFDRKTGDLYFADSGDELEEEVDIEAPNTGHFDYEWPRYEGDVCHDGSNNCGAHGKEPAFTRPHAQGTSVIIGGAVYRGTDIPCLRGRYIYGVFEAGIIASFVWDGTTVTSEADLSDDFNDINILSPSSFPQDAQGEMYITTFDGGLFKIVAK